MLEKELIGRPPLQGEVVPANYPVAPRKLPLVEDRPAIPMKQPEPPPP